MDDKCRHVGSPGELPFVVTLRLTIKARDELAAAQMAWEMTQEMQRVRQRPGIWAGFQRKLCAAVVEKID